MLSVSRQLKNKIIETNQELRRMYPSQVFDREQLRDQLKTLGFFSNVEKWAGDTLEKWLEGGTLVGVDGSVNSTPGAHPHTLSLFQALAKGTRGEETWAADLYTPLLEEEEENEEGKLAREAKRRGSLLASLEIQVAIEAIERWKPKIIMMDGSLLHFLIDDASGWARLADAAITQGVLLVGVAEEIGTKSLARRLFSHSTTYSDRELLFGTLQREECYRSEAMDPPGTGLWKAVLCSTKHPQPVGIDGLLAQSEDREHLIQLVHTLTPNEGRGVPLWLDIVDREVRVTDALVRGMVEQYIDPDLRHRLLIPKRNDRHL
ncbi:DNA double-strand break repair nuclease NurA [Marininema halotolerans]|uniref:NurA domain-containing protein n=1 Tax=Marininema halotolerans TaxID=1155944 RepID=A0A1I6TD77_9BACL|nr:DNA double-strand break repair nuclease NurA [Marininema halotolerans]SFS87103.1 NurA domain-containing protein [Marininema halotolerans]